MAPAIHPGPELQLTQLHPRHRPIALGDALGSMNLGAHAHRHRPYTVVNFISSVDGRAAFRGRSGGLSDAGDRAMFHGLRERVDAVFVGTGTIRAERYGRLVPDQGRRARRAQAGLSPDPLAALISRSGDVPMDIPLLADPASRIALFTAADIDTSAAAAQIDLVRLDPGELTLTTMLRRLRADYDVRALLCEGGPTIFGSLLHEGLVDELCLTLAPKLAGGGTDPTITSGPALEELAGMELVWVLERDGTLFLRYSVGQPTQRG